MNCYYCKLSEVDKGEFTNIILDDITLETAFSAMVARDKTPVAQFYGLHDSYQELHAKLNQGQLHSAPEHNHLDLAGQEVASNVAVVHDTHIKENKSESATSTVNIVHQASVNRMEQGEFRQFGKASSVSFEAFFSND